MNIKRILVLFLVFTETGFAATLDNNETVLENYMICDVSLSKDDNIVSNHLVTTYQPSKAIMQLGDRAYHYSSTIAVNCISQAFEDRYNERNLYSDRKSKSFIDICFKISNGVELDRDGYAEIYLVERPKIDFFNVTYLNENLPMKLTGNSSAIAEIGDYSVDVKCKNKDLSAYDQLWTTIRENRLGNF